MGTQYLATSRFSRTPIRVQQWNASIMAGDDFKLAMTVYDDDGGNPSQVAGARSQILLWPDQHCGAYSDDYGFGWSTGGSPIGGPAFDVRQIAGFATTLRPGGINFMLAAADTLALGRGRYKLAIQVDLPDGSFTQVEGILQVRRSWGLPVLGHTDAVFFELDVTPLDSIYPLAPAVVNGIPVDVDGFPLTTTSISPTASVSLTSLTALVASLPTALPASAGVLWLNGGNLSISLNLDGSVPTIAFPSGGGISLTSLTTLIASLPIALPATAGVLWLNGNVLAISLNLDGSVPAIAFSPTGGISLTSLTALVASLPIALPATAGVLWLNGGGLQLS